MSISRARLVTGGALVGLLVVAAVAVAFNAARPLSVRGASNGPPPSLRSTADLSRPQGVYYYTIELIINYQYIESDIAGIRNQAHLFSERWVEIDADGNATRYRQLTVKPDGSVFQEQHYDSGVLSVGHVERVGDGATCSELDERVITGSTLPVASAEQLESVGFELASSSDIPAEVSERAAAFPGSEVYERPGRLGSDDRVVVRTSFYVLDPQRSQGLGNWNYGMLESGEQVLMHATVISPIEPATSTALETDVDPRPSCADIVPLEAVS